MQSLDLYATEASPIQLSPTNEKIPLQLNDLAPTITELMGPRLEEDHRQIIGAMLATLHRDLDRDLLKTITQEETPLGLLTLKWEALTAILMHQIT